MSKLSTREQLSAGRGRKLKGRQNGTDLQSVFTIRFYLSRSGKVLSTAHIGLLQTMERAFFMSLGRRTPTMPSTGKKVRKAVMWVGLVVQMGRPKGSLDLGQYSARVKLG
ncbi:hypothetical protein [Mesorhizobium sp. M0118]|uniref:hypothetical protein n=1 Tax=Mesorhizobium sp. M0118 TaxID=2956884 RepID=UPI00333AFF27